MTTAEKIPHPLWKTRLQFDGTLSGEDAQRLSDAIEEAMPEGLNAVLLHNNEATDGDDWAVSVTTYGPPDEAALRACITATANLPGLAAREALVAERLPETDWLRHVHDNFPPVAVADFFIYGSHYEGPLPAGLIPLKIDAATAFGSGEHETTKGCLIALCDLKKQGRVFKNVLDMGCGSGILAIACDKLWPGVRLSAVDIDPESVIVTQRHAEMNNVTGMTTEAGNGYNAALVDLHAPYDLVIANILAGPLVEMAPDAARVLSDDGVVILSGLLARQEEDVVVAYRHQGLELHESLALGDWRALVLRR